MFVYLIILLSNEKQVGIFVATFVYLRILLSIETPVGIFAETNFTETCIYRSVDTLSVDKSVDASVETLSIEMSLKTYSVDAYSLEMSVETHFKNTLVKMANLAGTYVETSV